MFMYLNAIFFYLLTFFQVLVVLCAFLSTAQYDDSSEEESSSESDDEISLGKRSRTKRGADSGEAMQGKSTNKSLVSYTDIFCFVFESSPIYALIWFLAYVPLELCKKYHCIFM